MDAPYMLMGDDLRIQQVLINLTANALKFTHQGFVRVSAMAPAQTDHCVGLRFEVRDTGIGIGSENAGKIFDRFTQANPGIHRQYGGSGLGTTICKHLVELMGGAIGFDSPPGDGTTFWFTVQLLRQPAEAYEDGGGVQMRGARPIFLSGRPGAGDWLANTARDREMQYWACASIEEALATVRVGSSRGPCVLIVDGEDDRIHWSSAPEAVRGGPTQVSCMLIHPHIGEMDAFDAGYACLLTTREPRLLCRAGRSIVAGTSALQPPVDFSGQAIPGRRGLHILVAEDNQISQQIIAMMLQSGGHQVTLVSDGESILDEVPERIF